MEHQAVPIHGATDWEHARIGSEDFLIVANATDDLGFDIDPEVLR